MNTGYGMDRHGTRHLLAACDAIAFAVHDGRQAPRGDGTQIGRLRNSGGGLDMAEYGFVGTPLRTGRTQAAGQPPK
ncbi:hypothetical protein GCM10027065_34470 [Rhodanobacter koreensis]